MKHSLRLELERAAGPYPAGGRLAGRIVIETGHGAACRSVSLNRAWGTEGLGTSDRGLLPTVSLHEGPLRAGPPYQIPFEVDVPPGPFTYRGTVLSVEHVVSASARFQGARTLEVTRPIVVAPGALEVPEGLLEATGKRVRGCGCRDGAAAGLVLLGFLTLPLGVILMVLGLALLVPAFKRALATARIGRVEGVVGRRIVAPGRAFPVEVRISPKRAGRIREASVRLRGREVAVTEDDDGRKRHVRVIHDETRAISALRSFQPGERVVLRGEVELPDEAPCTFSSAHNEVTWDVTLAVDIPAWPDWSETFSVVVWPDPETTALAAPLRAPPAPTPHPPPLSGARAELVGALETLRDRKLDQEAPGPTVRPVPQAVRTEPSDHAAPGDDPRGIVDVLREILAEKPYGGERDALVETLMGRSFEFELTVEQNRRSLGARHPEYRFGRTLIGAVDGDITVEVRFPESMNARVESLARGAACKVRAEAVDWERLGGRAVFRSQPT